MSDKVKIVVASCHPSSRGGISTWVRLMQRRLEKDQEVDVRYLYPAYAGEKEINAAQRTEVQRIFCGTKVMLQRLWEFKRLLKNDKPDLLHLTTSGSLSLVRDLALIRAAQKKDVYVVYHIRFGRIPELSLRDNWEWKLLQRAVHSADAVVVIDEKTEKTLQKYFAPAKIVKIPNPFDLKNRKPALCEEPDHTVIFVGWVIKTKGIEELLTAWEHVSKAYPDWKLKLVGPLDEQYSRELHDKFSLEKVIFTGEKSHDDAMAELNKAAVFILPSYTEGFPNSVLEAMALHKPVIAAAVGAIPEMLREQAGIVVPARNASALEAALMKVMGDKKLRDQMAQNAYDRLIREYELETVLEQYKKIWKAPKSIKDIQAET